MYVERVNKIYWQIEELLGEMEECIKRATDYPPEVSPGNVFLTGSCYYHMKMTEEHERHKSYFIELDAAVGDIDETYDPVIERINEQTRKLYPMPGHHD